jgi:hypothetical protein
MILLSHQLLRMPTCGDTRGGAVAVPRQTMRRTDIRTRCKANCTCGTVQRTVWLRGALCRAIGDEPLPKTCEQCEFLLTRIIITLARQNCFQISGFARRRSRSGCSFCSKTRRGTWCTARGISRGACPIPPHWARCVHGLAAALKAFIKVARSAHLHLHLQLHFILLD